MAHNIVHYLKKTYDKYPNRIVCADETEEITYQELWCKSQEAASVLIRRIKVGNPVPVIMKKSCRTLIAIWGIIKAGGCYVMIDPSLPRERINNILRVSGAKSVILGGNGSIDKFEDLDALTYDELFEIGHAEQQAVEQRIQEICDIDPLYIMFTSGSTGMPKGVAVSHRSVVDFIDCFTELFQITSDDVIGNQAPWDFDVSVKDIYSAIWVGAKIQIIPPKYFSFPSQLVDLLEEKRITTLIWAVSALCIVSSRNVLSYKRPSYINKVIFSGEVMPVKQFNIWRGNYPDALFVNVYGPTEITCNCTYAVLGKDYGENEVLPIGRAFPNERVYLLSEDGRLVSSEQAYEIGEICVAGTAVAMGYYNNKTESELSFVQNPFITQYEEKIYKTGDLGYYDKSGNLFFKSRKDFQIKHMGHRIELSEIEKAINGIDGVRMNCCIYYESKIIGFVEGDVDTKDLQRELKKKLPGYMVPHHYFMMDSLPLNLHGKIDRKKLILYGEENGYGSKPEI